MDSSLLEPIMAIANGESIEGLGPSWRSAYAVCTVLASGGYPGRYEKGKPIRIPDELMARSDVLLFHAGTRRAAEGELVTDGGRVLGAVGLGERISDAADASRAAADAVDFDGKYFRGDIGFRELERETD